MACARSCMPESPQCPGRPPAAAIDSSRPRPLSHTHKMKLAELYSKSNEIGYRVGTVSVFRKSGTHTYMESDGLQPVGVMDIKEAPDGAIWVAMRDGLAVLPAGGMRFQYMKEEAGLPPRGIFQILFARNGATWIATNRGIYFREKGQRNFSHALPRLTLVSLAEAEDGTIWAGDVDKQIYKIRPGAVDHAESEFDGLGVLLDRHEIMWVRHSDRIERKLLHGSPSKADQYLTKADSLSGPMPNASFEDREGNLWFGDASQSQPSLP